MTPIPPEFSGQENTRNQTKISNSNFSWTNNDSENNDQSSKA